MSFAHFKQEAVIVKESVEEDTISGTPLYTGKYYRWYCTQLFLQTATGWFRYSRDHWVRCHRPVRQTVEADITVLVQYLLYQSIRCSYRGQKTD